MASCKTKRTFIPFFILISSTDQAQSFIKAALTQRLLNSKESFLCWLQKERKQTTELAIIYSLPVSKHKNEQNMLNIQKPVEVICSNLR